MKNIIDESLSSSYSEAADTLYISINNNSLDYVDHITDLPDTSLFWNKEGELTGIELYNFRDQCPKLPGVIEINKNGIIFDIIVENKDPDSYNPYATAILDREQFEEKYLLPKEFVLNEKYIGVIESCIRQIDEEYQRLYWNKYQEEPLSPIENNGARVDFNNFFIHAYNWNDEEEQEPNFQYKSLKFYWYKHLGRGNYATSEEEISIDFLGDMLEECFNDMKKNLKTN